MKMRWGYTSAWNELATEFITQVTGGPFAHCFAVFYPEQGRPMYFESIVKSWSQPETRKRKNGVRGPLLLDTVYEWLTRDIHNRRLHLQPMCGYLPFATTEVEAAYNTLAAAVHDIRYSPAQIFHNWLEQRLGLYWHWGRGSTRRWTCSETCIRVVPSRYWHYYDLLNLRADNITPSGRRGMSLFSGTEALIAAEGTRS